jgi:hypothetical protein
MFQTFCYFIVIAGLGAGLAQAQPFSAGLKAGVPLTDALSVQPSNPLGYVESTGRYIIGPFVEVRLPLGLSLEADALYRGFSFNSFQGGVSAGSWEFPVLAKYRLLPGPLRPYVEGGLVFSHLTAPQDAVQLIHRNDYGIVLGAGLEIHALVLRISPEIRYEGFLFHNFDSPGHLLESNRNQAMVLVGISF